MAKIGFLGLGDMGKYLNPVPKAVVNAATATSLGLGDFGAVGSGSGRSPIVNITISDNAKKLVDVVMDTTQDQSASGIPTQITRNAKNLAW